jgi:hypothetical protein
MLIFYFFFFFALYNFHISPVCGSIISLHGGSQCLELDIHVILRKENYIYIHIYEHLVSCIRKQCVLFIKGTKCYKPWNYLWALPEITSSQTNDPCKKARGDYNIKTKLHFHFRIFQCWKVLFLQNWQLWQVQLIYAGNVTQSGWTE